MGENPSQRWPGLGASVAIAVLVAGAVGAACSESRGRLDPKPRPTAPATTTAASAATVPSALPDGAAPGTTVDVSVPVNGVIRTYRLHAPTAFDPARPAPVVIVLHGATGNAGRVELRYHWDALSDRDGFFVVYPQGVLDQWNAVLDSRAEDDVSFFSALVDRLVGTLPVDGARVYVAGMSNGAAMAYRLGCVLSDRVAAIAPVEGATPGCEPSQPVSMVVVHGLADQQVSFASAQRSLAAWREYDGCPADAQVEQRDAVTHSVWAPCAAGTAVELYAVDGGGHEWPGSSPPLPGHDPPSPDLDATQVIWDFFRQQHR